MAPTSEAELHASSQSLLSEVLGAWTRRDGASDRRFYQGGRWLSADQGCWFCQLGPATATALLWDSRGRPADGSVQAAIRSFDRALRVYSRPDGSFGDPRKPDTTMFGAEFSAAYLSLRTRLDEAHRRRWGRALADAADYLRESGNLTWYTNGNINLQSTLVLYGAWVATGQSRFRRLYDGEWAFLLSPPQARWPGFGLRMAHRPSRADGADGAGYLAESGGGPPGFDGDYAQLQLDMASRIWLLTGDVRARRLANLLANYLIARLRPDGMLDVRGGTRSHWTEIPFISSGPAVLAFAGGRSDLRGVALRQWSTIARFYAEAESDGGATPYRGVSIHLSVILEATEGSAGVKEHGRFWKPARTGGRGYRSQDVLGTLSPS